MSNPVNSMRPFPDWLNRRIHSTSASTSSVFQVQKYIPADELFGVAFPVEHVLVESVRLRHVRFDRKDGEAELASRVLDEPVLHLEYLARSVGALAERDDARVADHRFERLQVGEPVARLRRRQANRVSANPVRDWLILNSPGAGQRRAGEHAGQAKSRETHCQEPLLILLQNETGLLLLSR